MHNRSVFNKAKGILIWLISLSIILPIYLLVINSLKTPAESGTMNFSFPNKWVWNNYIEAINRGHLIRAFFNSLLMSSTSVILCVIVTSSSAFILARNRSGINKAVYNYFFIGLVAPLNYITTIRVLQLLHINNMYTGIILVYAALGIPFAMFLYYGFINSVPRELDEAAIIDGCGLSRLFISIVFPLLKPVTITAIVLNFLGAWNDFITPLYLLDKQKKWGMVNSIYNFYGVHFNEWNMIFAVIVLSLIPVWVLYIFGQKYIVSGMTAGSVKG
jgi:ABC-type sugar transport system, permease component